jgi:ABC-type Fe3+ transport system permease subunit
MDTLDTGLLILMGLNALVWWRVWQRGPRRSRMTRRPVRWRPGKAQVKKFVLWFLVILLLNVVGWVLASRIQ